MSNYFANQIGPRNHSTLPPAHNRRLVAGWFKRLASAVDQGDTREYERCRLELESLGYRVEHDQAGDGRKKRGGR